VVREGVPGKLVPTATREVNCKSLVSDLCTSKITTNYKDNTTIGSSVIVHFVAEFSGYY